MFAVRPSHLLAIFCLGMIGPHLQRKETSDQGDEPVPLDTGHPRNEDSATSENPGIGQSEMPPRVHATSRPDPIRLLGLSPVTASMVRRRAGVGDANVGTPSFVHDDARVAATDAEVRTVPRAIPSSTDVRTSAADTEENGFPKCDSVSGDRGRSGEEVGVGTAQIGTLRSGERVGDAVRGGSHPGRGAGRDGEEHLRLPWRVGGVWDSGTYVTPGDSNRGSVTGAFERKEEKSRHLLSGLAPQAIRLVKDRIFAAARAEYVRLCGSRQSIAASMLDEGELKTESFAMPTASVGRDASGCRKDLERDCQGVNGAIGESDVDDTGDVGRKDKKENDGALANSASNTIAARTTGSSDLSCPGSGALQSRMQEFMTRPAFLSWVEGLRRWSAAAQVCDGGPGVEIWRRGLETRQSQSCSTDGTGGLRLDVGGEETEEKIDAEGDGDGSEGQRRPVSFFVGLRKGVRHGLESRVMCHGDDGLTYAVCGIRSI